MWSLCHQQTGRSGGCARDNNEILSALAKNLRKMNVCVEDQRRRVPDLLPPVLKLSFVVQPVGKVTDFSILDRNHRSGPLKNCMAKVFRQLRYQPTSGEPCPVQIPIKIGN